MKNLNIYGDKSKEIIISEGRLEDINDLHKISYISVTESNTDHLINFMFSNCYYSLKNSKNCYEILSL